MTTKLKRKASKRAAAIEKRKAEILMKYPKIFRQYKLPMTETCMCWGLEVGPGWLDLIDELCDTLTFHTEVNDRPQVEARQVKEKMGGLRFYWQTAPDWKPKPKSKKGYQRDLSADCGYIDGIIDTYESMATKICDECGKPGVLSETPDGWLRTVCPRHAKKDKYKPVPKYDWRKDLIIAGLKGKKDA